MKRPTLELVKNYCRVDYDDDDEILEIIIDAVNEELAEVIPDYNADEPTARQKVLFFTSVKELYENREKRTDKPETLRAAISSMLIKEMFK